MSSGIGFSYYYLIWSMSISSCVFVSMKLYDIKVLPVVPGLMVTDEDTELDIDMDQIR